MPQHTEKRNTAASGRRPLFRTVYAKLLAIFVSVITLAMILQGLLIGNVFNRFYEDQIYKELESQCAHIAEIIPDWRIPERRNLIQKEIEMIARQYHAAIWIVYANGETRSIADFLQENNSVTNLVINTQEDYIRDVLKFHVANRKYHDSPVFHDRVMSIGYPWVRNGVVEGGIFMHVSLSAMSRTLNDMTGNIALSASIAILGSIIAISIIAHRFSTPLSEMNKVVKSYAKGDFSERVAITSGDEVGQLATSVNAMAEDLEGLETMRRSFVANVSHELKSPLSSMRGFVQAILDGSIPQAESREYMQIVYDETLRLNDLINDLLDLSKIESGHFPLHETSFDANELILRTLLTFETRISDENIDVDIAFEDEHCIVYADADRVTQVYRNLIDNAVKYAGKGSQIRVVSRSLPGGSFAEFQIADNGQGISEEDLPHVFERFYKADKAHTPGAEGTGLGLSIVKQIILQHGCDIDVESACGQGTRFIFTLPTEAADA